MYHITKKRLSLYEIHQEYIMIKKELNDSVKSLKEPDKVNFLINHLFNKDDEWNKLHVQNEKLCINIATSFSGIGSPEYALNRLQIKHNIFLLEILMNFAKKHTLRTIHLVNRCSLRQNG